MSLKCKAGDMALVVKGFGSNAGKVVTCIELLPREAHQVADEEGPIWRVNRPMQFRDMFGRVVERHLAPDKFLMPIKPGDDVPDLAEADSLVTS